MDEFVARMDAAGVHLNNLFQLPGGGWRCNIRKAGSPREPGNPGNWTHEFADAPTWREAVEKALAALGVKSDIPKSLGERWANAFDRATIGMGA